MSKRRVTAIRREIRRRERDQLRRSIRDPHPERVEVAEAGWNDWVKALPAEELADVVDPTAGKAVRWEPGKGWTELPE